MTKNEKGNTVAALRRNLHMRVKTAPGGHYTWREATEHEAAHIVVALAIGADVLMVHVGASFGGERLSASDVDGMAACVAMTPETVSALGAFAVAGMVWDISDWLGPADAAAMLQHLRERLGEQWPMRRPLEVAGLVWKAIGAASFILAEHGEAVRAVADLIESHGGTILDGAIIRKTVSRFMRLNKLPAYPHQTWNQAMFGIAEAEEAVTSVGLGGLLKLAKRQASQRAVAVTLDARRRRCKRAA